MKKLYLGNLPFQATEEEVQALFAEAGVKPESLTLVRDRFTGQPRGFGFAEITTTAKRKRQSSVERPGLSGSGPGRQ